MPPAPGGLPRESDVPGWDLFTSEEGDEYYFNHTTGESSWVKPKPVALVPQGGGGGGGAPPQQLPPQQRSAQPAQPAQPAQQQVHPAPTFQDAHRLSEFSTETLSTVVGHLDTPGLDHDARGDEHDYESTQVLIAPPPPKAPPPK